MLPKGHVWMNTRPGSLGSRLWYRCGRRLLTSNTTYLPSFAKSLHLTHTVCADRTRQLPLTGVSRVKVLEQSWGLWTVQNPTAVRAAPSSCPPACRAENRYHQAHSAEAIGRNIHTGGVFCMNNLVCPRLWVFAQHCVPRLGSGSWRGVLRKPHCTAVKPGDFADWCFSI